MTGSDANDVAFALTTDWQTINTVTDSAAPETVAKIAV